MYDEFLKHASSLRAKDEPFVIATVVRCQAPTSGKPGDRAIVTQDGMLTGWIGGGCAQPIVIQEALKALKDYKPRLVRVSPDTGAEPVDGITGYTMMCHSGGTLDIFIEPILPQPHLVILGRSPVAQTLARLAEVLSYRVSTASATGSAGVSADTPIVVATQGEDDEGALEAALKTQSRYVAFVASKKKWAAVSQYLKEKGIDEERLKSVKAPAGLQIGAISPEEIAVSVLAQIIEFRHGANAVEEIATKVATTNATAKDPVCGMTVNIASAKHVSDLQGQRFYFCCAPCKTRFDKKPERFLGL